MPQTNDRPPLTFFRDVKGEEIAARAGTLVFDRRTGEPVAPGSNLGVRREELMSDERE